MATAIISGSSYAYPVSYGAGCGAHDLGLAPFCGGVCDGNYDAMPSYCRHRWCWVDPANCTGLTTPARNSSYFAGTGLAYS